MAKQVICDRCRDLDDRKAIDDLREIGLSFTDRVEGVVKENQRLVKENKNLAMDKELSCEGAFNEIEENARLLAEIDVLVTQNKLLRKMLFSL